MKRIVHDAGEPVWQQRAGFFRRKLSPQIVVKLSAHIKGHDLGLDALLCSRHSATAPPLHVVADAFLGFIEPNEEGRQYRHGTLSAYNAGKCRCAYCRGAFADYRAKRRAETGSSPDQYARLTATSTWGGTASGAWFGGPHARLPVCPPACRRRASEHLPTERAALTRLPRLSWHQIACWAAMAPDTAS
jgi:hypothetical protein